MKKWFAYILLCAADWGDFIYKKYNIERWLERMFIILIVVIVIGAYSGLIFYAYWKPLPYIITSIVLLAIFYGDIIEWAKQILDRRDCSEHNETEL